MTAFLLRLSPQPLPVPQLPTWPQPGDVAAGFMDFFWQVVQRSVLALVEPLARALMALVFSTGNPEGGAFVSIQVIRDFEPAIQGAADAALVLVTVWGFYRAIWAHEMRTQYTARILLPRLMVAALLINFSQPLFQEAVDFNNVLCQTVLRFGLHDTFGTFVGNLNSDFLHGAGPLPQILVTLLLLLGYCVLAFAYLVRHTLLVVLAITAPLAGLLFALPETHSYSKAWTSLFVPTLLMQPLQLLILSLGSRIEFGNAFPVRHLFALAALFIAFKVPGALHSASAGGSRATSLLKREVTHVVHVASRGL
ncbi:MAG TPA: hypothetical protein VK131_14215 [Candidatus Acidoferrales bacterium]|nr:hypothetical protein [Candidatus Acidoferrales bacterium]